MGRHRIDWQETPPGECRAGVVAIGNFDGVHRGHASLIEELCRQSRDQNVPGVVVTFDPHPRELLAPDHTPPLLTTTEDRSTLLQELGAGQVLILHTTAELLALSAAEFFRLVIQEHLQAVALVEGTNFGFGRNREGNVETLGQLCRSAHLPLTVVPPVVLDGQAVSSSAVRQTLLRGDAGQAARLLGRPYRLHGSVGTGQRRGQTLGFPTANLEQTRTLIPADGVYAVRVLAPAGIWPGAANIGPNPTFAEQARKVEVHLIGFQGNLYNQPLAVDFLQRLRDTRPFAGVKELVEQLHHDIDQARQIAAT